MIRKLRLKFVAICMILISLVLSGVFFSIYSSAQHSVEITSRERQVLPNPAGRPPP